MADLTTLDAVKAYLGIASSNQDAMIPSLITRESALIEQWCGRTFGITTRSVRVNGTGTQMLVLPDSPIVSVSSIKDGNTTITASPDGVSYGWVADDERLYLMQGRFCYGKQNIAVSYVAGYQASETDTIPSSNPATIAPVTSGKAISAVSVVNAASGAAFTQVASAPAASQFSFAAGVFTFNTADANTSGTLTYGYVPPPVEQACIEMVGIDLRNRDNLGLNSKTLGGESISYSSKGMNQSVLEQLTPYRRRFIA